MALRRFRGFIDQGAIAKRWVKILQVKKLIAISIEKERF
jgi:hypothetical protein